MDALLIVFASGLISLFAAFAKKPWLVVSSAMAGLLAAIIVILNQLQTGKAFFDFLKYEGLLFDDLALVYSLAICVLALLIVGLGYERFKENPVHTGEYIGLLIFSTVGAMIMTAYTDMFMFFLGLEILSIPIYVMAGSNKTDIRSSEASLKYFLTGSFASGIFLFGLAWVYGATGTFRLWEIQAKIMEMESLSPILMIGVLLIMASFIFKIGAAPFHFWSPDVYDGAPHAVTGFMASVVKISAFYAFLKMFIVCFGFGELLGFWQNALVIMIIITMFVGNLSALRQVKFKRLLAYSSITHVGYTLLVFVSNSMGSVMELWFYMFAYGFSIVGVIGVGLAVNDQEDRIEAWRGLGKRNPFLAIVGIVSLLSLAGIPPTAGFFAKYIVFSSAWANASWLVIIALINSAISIYYYLKVIATIISPVESGQEKIKLSPLTIGVLTLALIGMLGFSVIVSWL
ncbi:NADH-quinone oxidoreductase subunit N [Fluviicola sp.]|jgi:NADH-quinone oxidoreductase subunit N|uniref:NADH-quinone oxidoreductase subunit N n=1 Tax=Fluviicola sp. TaxID=1917219 RepID=UPI00281DFE13|nr:NADH-quinone oxidoreductase subunit N [Fluviicola sp.]MDR0802305.1 NADH-quinone oxidoreductase subunit N [Fluviicola sp.]